MYGKKKVIACIFVIVLVTQSALASCGRSNEDDVDAGTTETDAGHGIVSEMSENQSNDFHPKYHLSPVKGWMNDPNGLCFFNGVYHLFYQYNPYSSFEPGIAHWAHAVSEDLFHWRHLPIAMYPDQWYDKQGVFSGSCIVIDDVMHLYYTGNVIREGETPDRNEYQALALSSDGINVTKYEKNPIISATEFQPNIRDPKVWKHGDKYYMVIGNSFVNSLGETLGRILLWISTDKINWEMASVLLESDGKLGYMFECPDLFELNGYYVLLFSPQGMKPEGDKYRNLYQTGYVVGDFDYETNKFTPLYDFKELDLGHDFYTTQSNLDRDGNRFVIGWMDMWEQNYPERYQGFTGQMTLPRVITLTKTGQILQEPPISIFRARGRMIHSDRIKPNKVFVFENNAAEIVIKTTRKRNFELLFLAESLTVTIKYDSKNGYVTLDRGGDDGVRGTSWRPNGSLLIWKIYIDSSSIEVFYGAGEVVMSSRIFPKGNIVMRVGKSSVADFARVTILNQTVEYLN